MNGFDTFLQVIEFLDKNEREFEIDVNVLEMDGIDAVPHATFKETLLLKNNKGDIPRRGDIYSCMRTIIELFLIGSSMYRHYK